MSISSHEEKMLNLQHQMRQNQSELQDYLAGLNDWTSEIKEKEKNLKSSSTSKAGDLPPVRNTIEKKKMKKKKKEKIIDSSKPKRISGYDFRAWDKFDVDKALDEIDENKKKTDTSSSEYETDEEWEMERKKHLAETEKEKGNKFLKAGDYERAVEAYTKGMEFDSTNSILPANRALALIKQQKFGAAELDCTTSIVLDPLYVKAYLRRATARAGIGRTQDAISDYHRVLDLEPSNKQAKTELERLEKELSREKEEPVQSSFTEGQKGVVKPVYKPPAERSKVPLKRIEIEEIGIEVASRPHRSSATQSETVQKITAKEEQAFDSLFTSSPPRDRPSKESDTIPSSSSKTCDSSNGNSFHLSNGPSNQPCTQSDINPLPISSNPALQSEKSEKSDISKTSSTSTEQVTTKPKSQYGKLESSSTGTTSLGSDIQLPVPQSSFQFQADFKLLKNKPDQFLHYLQAIPPIQYPKLFGQCLDADILNAILKSVHMHKTKTEVDLYEVLDKLTLVKRFSMTAMFLSSKDKKVVEDLLKHIADKGQHSQREIDSLRQKYQL